MERLGGESLMGAGKAARAPRGAKQGCPALREERARLPALGEERARFAAWRYHVMPLRYPCI